MYLIPRIFTARFGVDMNGNLMVDDEGVPLDGDDCHYHSVFLVFLWFKVALMVVQWPVTNTLTGKRV